MATSDMAERILATDLDGTLIPIQVAENRQFGMTAEQAETRHRQSVEALAKLRSYSTAEPPRHIQFVFITGRHFESVLDAMQRFDLPIPDFILCDVGSSIYRRDAQQNIDDLRAESIESLATHFHRDPDYDRCLADITGDFDGDELRRELASQAGARLQEDFKQARFKLSFYADQETLSSQTEAVSQYLDQRELPFGVISSVDPFNGDGLIDVMPSDVSKAFALDWWLDHEHSGATRQVVFAGDSGNDLAALVSGTRAIVVGNADRKLALKVAEHHRRQGWQDRLYLADAHSSAGVLEGCRWFGLVDAEEVSPNSREERCPSQIEMTQLHRHLGAIPVSADRTSFTLFAPGVKRVELLRSGAPESPEVMDRTEAGYHSLVSSQAAVGTDYWYRLDGGQCCPDPASRFQPEGVHGPSRVVNPRFAWSDQDWQGVARDDLILYELHIGTFTDEGTFAAAIERLDELVALGITAIELMPVNGCAGQWNWGYDGVNWFAPMASYGTPDDLRRLVDAAHAKGLAVILDVVYNHFGPEGNYLHGLGGYVSEHHRTTWGDAPNFDQSPWDRELRRFVIANVIAWLSDYHFDGVRVDAIHCMSDDSQHHIVRQLAEAVTLWRECSGRNTLLIAESNVYDPEMLRELSNDGMGFDAQWCDCFLHSVFAVVRPGEQLTDRVYDSKTDLRQVLRSGIIYQGTVREPRQRMNPDGRVASSGLVYCIQNHDFIGNHPLGQRLHQLTSPATQRAAAALLLLSPSIPMLFMGEEFACEHPFSFFVDFGDQHLRDAVVAGRKAEYPQHDWDHGTLPTDPGSFHGSKIGPREAGSAGMLRWYRKLIELRKRWKDEGLIDADHMTVHCDVNDDLYGWTYHRGDRRVVVGVRLPPAASQRRTVNRSVSDWVTGFVEGTSDGSQVVSSGDAEFRHDGEEALPNDDDASPLAWIIDSKG